MTPRTRRPPVLRIFWRAPDEFRPSLDAAKAHPPEQIEALARSIALLGFDQPLVVDNNDTIIKGHGRLRAALFLGLDQVPAIVRQDLEPDECRLARLADNCCAESHWLPDILTRELEALADQAPHLLPASGFSEERIQGLLQRRSPPAAAFPRYRPDAPGLERQCPRCGAYCVL